MYLPEKDFLTLAYDPGEGGERKGRQHLKELSKFGTIITCGNGGYYGNASTPRLNKLYAAADLFIFPASADNSPNMVLESMACGTPVLALKGTGAEEDIEDGKTGFLTDDIADMCNKVKYLSHQHFVENIGRNAYQYVQNNRLVKHEVDKFIPLYK